jgi:hypothetical protein
MRILVLSILTVILCAHIEAQSVIHIPKLKGEVNLDGKISEDIWDEALVFPMIMQTPIFGKDPSEETDIRIFFDDDFLYASGKMYYQDINQLSRPGKQRDYFSGNCDWFCILLDSFNDDENMISFATNPNGLRFDAASKNDAAMGFEDINVSWNTFWDVETTIDEKGWYAEMRIPISSLRFQVEDDTVNMGLTIFRFIPKLNETQTFPAIDPKYGEMASWKSSLAAPIQLVGIVPNKPIYITPYATVGYERINELNDLETSYLLTKTPKYSLGLDAKIGITNNLTLDLTVNTDFAQVEADDQQINLTRFSLYFPEKRPFFLEKADVFNFDYLGGQNLFYSRRIGISDEETVPIIGGARLTGRIGKWDIGLLDMQTASKEDIVGENFGVIRTKKSVINSSSFIGGMFTSRIGTDGKYNYAYGIDGVFRPYKDDYITFRWSQTFETGATNKALSEDPSRVLIRWERRNLKGLSYDILYTWSGKEYNPGVGFELIEDYYAARGTLKYGWLPTSESSNLRIHSLSNTSLFLYNSIDRSLQSIMSMGTWDFSSRQGYSGSINLRYNKEIVKDSLTFSKSDVPPGTYDFFDIMMTFMMRPGTKIGGMMITEVGQFYDGLRFTMNMMPTLNISPSLDINPTYRFDRVSFQDRGQDFTNHILGIKSLYMINTRLSIIGFAQYNTSIESWLVNARFRYNPREGNDFYIVYNEGLNTNLMREVPALPRSESRVIMAKYTYTFGF